MKQKIFPRISRLPPYVFSVIGELKVKARLAGEDVVDMSMGFEECQCDPAMRVYVE